MGVNQMKQIAIEYVNKNGLISDQINEHLHNNPTNKVVTASQAVLVDVINGIPSAFISALVVYEVEEV